MKRKTTGPTTRPMVPTTTFQYDGTHTTIDGIAQPRRFIIIEREAFGLGFDVKIIPPIEGENLDAEFPNYKRARGWASGLRLTRGWAIRDLTEEGSAM